MTYVDTSVLVSYYCPEARSRRAQSALERADEPSVSWLVEVEFAAALAAKLRLGEIARSEAERVATAFAAHLEAGVFTRVPVDGGDFVRARGWLGSFGLRLRTLDALHLAVAAGRGAELLTADRGLAEAAAGVGVGARLLT